MSPLGSPRARTGLAVAIAAFTYAAGSVLVLQAAMATEQERITVAEGGTARRIYSPILASEPARATVKAEADLPAISPEECNQTPANCDVVPFTVVPPAQVGSDFLIRISLSWDQEKVPSTDVGTSDLDMYLWTDPVGEQTATTRPEPAEGEEEDETRVDNPGASLRNPERLNFFTDRPGDYLLVINNSLGQNDGHELEIIYFSGELVPPFESLDPTVAGPAAPAPPTPPAPAPGPTAPPTGSGGANLPPLAAPAGPAPAPVPPPLAEVPADPSADFDDIETVGDDILAAPPEIVDVRFTDVSPAAPVSGAVLWVWFGAVPVVTLGGAGAYLRRRDPAGRLIRLATASAPPA